MSADAWIIRNDANRRFLMEHLQKQDLDKPLTVEINEGEQRTKLQNAFLNGWIYRQGAQLLEDAGIVIDCDDGTEHPYTRDVIHEIMRRKYLTIGELKAKGRTLPIIQSTAELTTGQFCEYVDNVRGFFWQFWRVQIPDPPGRFKAQWEEWRDIAAKEQKEKGRAA